MRTASNEGQVHLNAQHQAEFYKIQEEAKSKTSKLRSDHDSLQTAQVPHLIAARIALLFVPVVPVLSQMFD